MGPILTFTTLKLVATLDQFKNNSQTSYAASVQTPPAASIAQWLEHWSCKPGVRSSTLRGGLCPIKHFNIFIRSTKN